jgi:hypothetical protein
MQNARAMQRNVIRVLIGGLYFECGFQHHWYRKRGKPYPSRLQFLKSKSSELHECGLDEVDLEFLAGTESPYCKCGNDFFPVDEMDLTNATMRREMWEYDGSTKEQGSASGQRTIETCSFGGLSVYDGVRGLLFE